MDERRVDDDSEEGISPELPVAAFAPTTLRQPQLLPGQRPSQGTPQRGSLSRIANRFEKVHREPDSDHWEYEPEELSLPDRIPTQFLDDATQSIVSENSSPDIPFRYSINPYRGCEHGCVYCKPYPFSASLGSLPIHPLGDDRNHFQRLDFRLMQGVRQ